VKHSEQSVAEPSLESDTPARSSAVRAANSSRWIAPAGLAAGVVALAVTLVQWFHPSSYGHGRPSFSDSQVKDAKTSVCVAYTNVHRAVVVNTHLQDPPDGGPVGPLAVATSARLALFGGGSYLRDRLAKEPATPGDLAHAVDSLATTLEDLAVNYLADVPGFVQDPLRQSLDRQLEDVDGRCK
jgi:hypothetical protein